MRCILNSGQVARLHLQVDMERHQGQSDGAAPQTGGAPVSYTHLDVYKRQVVISFVIFNAENMGQALSDIGGLFGAGGIPLVSAEAVYCLRSFALVLILAVLGATPLLRNGLVRLSQYPTAGKVLNALEPFTLFVLLLVMTGYLVDGSFNPFLYFRF